MNGYRVLRPAFLQADSAIINKGCTGNAGPVPDAGVIVAAPARASGTDFASQQKVNDTDGSGTVSGGEDAGPKHPIMKDRPQRTSIALQLRSPVQPSWCGRCHRQF